ncbi:hypothetical protein AC480_02050 [miscellaneous Crenarchaeota group archaeon SMTZ1-55]|nr:MAG: hypothetical protein AC480_02050 [miscellaneous Crenarchaeota group archaeon SMTZ1-55]
MEVIRELVYVVHGHKRRLETLYQVQQAGTGDLLVPSGDEAVFEDGDGVSSGCGALEFVVGVDVYAADRGIQRAETSVSRIE